MQAEYIDRDIIFPLNLDCTLQHNDKIVKCIVDIRNKMTL
jgi:hypothetical protein